MRSTSLKIENDTVKDDVSSDQTFLYADENIAKFKHAIKKFVESIKKRKDIRY